MSAPWNPKSEVTDLTLASMHPGYVGVPQNITLHGRWDDSPEFAG